MNYASNVSVTSPTSLTIRLAAGLGQPYGGEGNIWVSDTTDGYMTATILIGAETATISPNALASGYQDTQINITGDNSDFGDQGNPVVVQVVYAATQEPAINLSVSQSVYSVYAAITDTTHASFPLPAGLGTGKYDVVVNDTTTDISMSIPLTIPVPSLNLSANGYNLPTGTVGTSYTSDPITTYVDTGGGTYSLHFQRHRPAGEPQLQQHQQ